jgi:hypothetical protein
MWLALTMEDGQGKPERAGDAMKVLVANLQPAIRRARGRWGCVALLGLALTACAGLQAYDLDQAVHHFSQTDTAARWGSPASVMALPAGQTLWIYTARYHMIVRPGSLMAISPGWVVDEGAECTQYLFLFDQAQMLRAWRARPC